jgi:hypothetical protein
MRKFVAFDALSQHGKQTLPRRLFDSLSSLQSGHLKTSFCDFFGVKQQS